ncbi:MAG: NAD(P)/FAD-dependent oxidoreductase [Gemmatimonadales bacterium]|nr:MAG: NAD(P)/FAD-dependent oxidoreductase [Gemmatimonadales bacterium]
MTKDIQDITIIGGGPTGLFAAFYGGMRGKSVRIIDSLPELGGQLMALYPEKHIYDVGGFPKVLAKDLALDLIAQAMQFDPEVLLDEEVREIHRDEESGIMTLVCRGGEYRTRAVVIAGGKGAFEPKKLNVPGYDDFLGKGVHYAVKDPEEFAGKRIVVVGGGDSALDWTLILKGKADRLVLVHRRDGFRAHENSVAQLQQAESLGEVEVRLFHEVAEISGNGRVEAVTLFDNRNDDRTLMEADYVLTFLGFKPDLGPIKNWGLEVQRNRIAVTPLMETNLPGIYGAGDIVDYEGKLDLIASGFAEAAIAVNNAVRFVDPSARVNPGHSTNMKVFK